MRMARSDMFVCYDDARARTFEPFALSRPWSEMRVGALLVRERWAHVTNAQPAGFLAGPAMRDFHEEAVPTACSDIVPAGTLVANSRFAVSLDATLTAAAVHRSGSRVAAVRLLHDVAAGEFADGSLTLDALAETHSGDAAGHVDGVWCDEVWDVVRHLSSLLARDIPLLARAFDCTTLASSDFAGLELGEHDVWIEDGASIEPYTVFDTSSGPVLLRNGARVQAFSRVSGPCYVGRDTIISGGRVGGSALGDVCKVNGEVSASVFVGLANKGHDGFIGHSVLGRWVNLGAGTTTSNLKNTYGTVALWTPDGVRDTGLQFLGTLFGDHVKTGIGLRLTTGCVLGAGANLVDQMPPKVVAPFAWGSGAPYDVYDAEKFVTTAERAMARRHIALGDGMQRHLREVHARRWTTG